MSKLEEKLSGMNLEQAKSFRAWQWGQVAIGGGAIVLGLPGLAAFPGAFVGGLLGTVGFFYGPEAGAIATGGGAAAGLIVGAVGGYAATAAYTIRKVYTGVRGNQKVNTFYAEQMKGSCCHHDSTTTPS